MQPGPLASPRRHPRSRRQFLAVGGLAVAVSLAGCSYFRALVGLGPTRPKVRVTDVAITSATFLSVELAVTLRVDNPNDFDLTFSKLRYQMTASDIVIAKGTYDPAIVIPKSGSGTVKLPLSIDAQAALLLVQELATGKKDIDAIIVAVANFATPLGDMEVDFQDKRPLRKHP